MGLLLLVVVILSPLLFPLAFFAPLILVPVLVVSTLVFGVITTLKLSAQVLDRAYVYRKSLTHSSWKGYKNAILKGDLESLVLISENFSNFNLSNVSFLHTKFLDMNFENCNLDETNFHNTDLCGSNMKDCHVLRTDFTGTFFNRNTVLPFSFESAISEHMSFLKSGKVVAL
jgi:hypothetical protein